jgi:hypothetical protein
MPIVFCVRLMCGLMAALLVVCGCREPSGTHRSGSARLAGPTVSINPRFFRTQFWITLGLGGAVAVLTWDGPASWMFWWMVAVSALAFVGSVQWALEGAPGGKTTIVLLTGTLVAMLVRFAWDEPGLMADHLTSAALLGTTTTAMLMGHSYLIAPTMSMQPLLRLLAAMAIALVLRGVLAGVGFAQLSHLGPETKFWLPVRWGLTFVGPAILGWMAWQSAKIRSTQSATGILYVAVVFCFLGELTGLLLLTTTGQML